MGRNQPRTSGVRPLPAHVEELCKNLTTVQLVSKLKIKRSCIGSRTVTAIREALARIGLPEIPEEEIRDVLGEALAVCKSPQHSNLNSPSQQRSAEQTARRPEARGTRQRPSLRPDGKELRARTTGQRRRRSSSEKDDHAHKEQRDSSLGTSSVRNAEVASVHAASHQQTVVLGVPDPVVELDELSSEELSFYCYGKRRSPVRNRAPMAAPHISSENGATTHMSEEPCGSPLRTADSAGSVQREEESSVGPGGPQETAVSDSDATDIDLALNDHTRASADDESRKEVEAASRKKRLCDTTANFFDESEAAERPASEPVSGAVVSPGTVWQDVQPRSSHRQSSSPAGQATTSRVDAQGISEIPRMCVKPPSRPDASLPVKRPRVRFTALEEEAIVYGVMKFGRGSWKEIRDEGLFNGRRPTELSDKYRNLEKYNRLPGVKQRVKAKLAARVNPLKELRAISKQKQRRDSLEQRTKRSEADVVSLPSDDDDGFAAPTKVIEEEPSKPREATNPSSRLKSASKLVSSDDGDLASSKQQTGSKELTGTEGASSSRAAVPSAFVELPSPDEKWSSDSEPDASENVPARPEPKEKNRRVPFTPLETEALVAGFMKYGKGNWARILTEGGFIGRTSIHLSDKIRNLRQYRHLPVIMETVKTKIARGEDPLRELRKVSISHWKR